MSSFAAPDAFAGLSHHAHLRLIRDYVLDNSLKPQTTLPSLLAFGNEYPPSFLTDLKSCSPLTFDGLHAHCVSSVFPQLPSLISSYLTPVLDGDKKQAEIFARRFEKVVSILLELSASHQLARVYAATLICRVCEVLEEREDDAGAAASASANKTRKALRVRGVSDYYYSLAAVLYHEARTSSTGRASYRDLIESEEFSSPWRAVKGSPHMHHKVVEGSLLSGGGPIRVNVLRIRPQHATFSCIDARSSAAQSLISTSAAAVSGGFFLYSEAPIEPPSFQTDPVGLLATGGKYANPPIFQRSAFIQKSDGSCAVEIVGLVGWSFSYLADASSGDSTPQSVLISQHNIHPTSLFEAAPQSPPLYSACSYNRALLSEISVPSNGWVACLVGSLVVSSSSSPGAALPVPLAGCAIVCFGTSPPPPPPAGLTVSWSAAAAPLGTDLRLVEAMSGGPLLLVGGEPYLDKEAEEFRGGAPPITFSQDETFDYNLLPRMAVGIDGSGDVYFAAFDGRDLSTPGFTLRMTSLFMRDIGCVTAMNLDGGSSKRMIICGVVVDSTSTEVKTAEGKSEVKVAPEGESIRALHTAIVINLR